MNTPAPVTGAPRSRRLVRLAVALAVGGTVALFALAAILIFEHWRGRGALESWQAHRGAHGDSLELATLVAPPNEAAQKFARRLGDISRSIPRELAPFAGISGSMVFTEPGRARRGSQEPTPPGDPKFNWPALTHAVDLAGPALTSLRDALREAPATMGDDLENAIATNGWPAFVPIRVGAQSLHTAILADLHRGDRDAALTNLWALNAMTRLHSEQATLVSFMIRVAISGLADDVLWDALQAPDWTETQLAILQEAALQRPRISEIPRVLEVERAARRVAWKRFRTHSYEDWLRTQEEIHRGFGTRVSTRLAAPLPRRWNQWVFHPVWSFAWADQEELVYLRHSQEELDLARDAVGKNSWVAFQPLQERLRASYRPPAARWRFYGGAPLHDDVASASRAQAEQDQAYPFPSYQRAWQNTFRILALRELAIAAVGLRRHHLRHGTLPATLEDLVPDFLAAVPRDLMDGRPLRYRPKSEGSFDLYSVGENGVDDGGDARPEGSKRLASMDGGRDWVWPMVAPGEETNPSRP